jgi:hypothetical protein
MLRTVATDATVSPAEYLSTTTAHELGQLVNVLVADALDQMCLIMEGIQSSAEVATTHRIPLEYGQLE